MCGIVGILGSRATRDTVQRMADAVKHRGPDGEGLWTAPGVALAHRRLSIIDLSTTGAQPMTSHDGRYQIVYNGEIFNYQELARKLPGTTWRGSSDTEILLEAYRVWGPRCLDELVGMFAFAIWDTEARTLFCARDRLGIKPLYYAPLGDGWAFASEIGALLAAGVPARANDAVIFDFLGRDFYDHTDGTFFAGIHQLPAASSMVLEVGRTPQPAPYWDLATEAARLTIADDRTARGERLIAMMQDAVGIALRSDVPVGITLSGGLDSAVLLALVDRVHRERIAAFSFEFAEAEYSERPWVEAMAAHSGHRTVFRTVSPDDFIATLDPFIAQQQEPHAGAPITAYTLCFERVRQDGTIVVMDGSGIDEGLAGYARFGPALWADLAAQGRTTELAAELAASGTTLERERGRMAAAASEHGDIGRGQDLTASVRPECMTPELAASAPQLPTFARPFPDALRNLMYRELRYTKLPRALRFRDRASMAYGTELRPPFLDHRLLAYMFALPAEDRISGGRSKALLRDVAEHTLPDSVRLAAKRSVQTPQREWFRGELAGWLRAQIDTRSFWDRGWVAREPALAALDQFVAGKGDNSFFIWQWLALHRWAERFLSGKGSA